MSGWLDTLWYHEGVIGVLAFECNKAGEGEALDTVCAHVWVSGDVQGVNFRADCRDEAAARGVGGWVRNLPDGRVEAVSRVIETLWTR